MPGLSFYDKQHIQKIAAQQAVIANIFNQFILSVSPYLHKWSDAGKNNVWIHNQRIESAVDRELLNLESMLYANISAFQKDGWERAERKNDDFISQFIKGMSISSATKDGMFAHSLSAFEALKNDIDANGFKLSDRVWNITQQTKSQLEFYLDSGVVAGRNANGISSDIRQILQNPQKRFRRIRNEKGELVLSQPMKNYHPGQGVYRSAYKNALRTSATTTNIAYRSADYERWSKQDFILGIEVHRSANNRGPCKICDAMVGKYPKTFKFTGFHPFCICFATPITMEPEDFADFLLNDTVPQEQVITDIPQAAKEFVSENKDGLQSAFWYKDNFTQDGNVNERLKIVVKQPEKSKQSVIEPISPFKESQSVEEAQNYATKLGVKYADFSDLSLDIANALNEALQTLPQEDMPLFVGSAKNLQNLSGYAIKKKGYHGITMENIIRIKENEIWKVENGTLVGINAKSINAITKAKAKIETEYMARTGHHWRFNTDGKSTTFHEIGHVFDQKHLVSSDSKWQTIAKKWAEESQCDILKTPSEAFAEAWAARNTGKELPSYITEYFKELDRQYFNKKSSIPKRIKTDAEKNDIQKRWDDRFVRNFNQAKIEQKIGVKKGKEMTFEEANELRGNINYGKASEYSVNCQSCVVANELRRRGYNVTALPNLQKTGNIPYELSMRTNWAWIDPKTMVIPKKQTAGGIYDITRSGALKSKSIKELTKELVELVKEPGRYHIDFAWKGKNSGHIITLEKLHNGKIIIYDPQTGKMKNWRELSKEISLRYGVNVLRVDNLLVNTDIIDGIVKKL